MRIVGPSHFPEMLQPIPKLRANEGGSFTTHAFLPTIGKERDRESERYIQRQEDREGEKQWICVGEKI